MGPAYVAMASSSRAVCCGAVITGLSAGRPADSAASRL
jgi:hypothetical protein